MSDLMTASDDYKHLPWPISEMVKNESSSRAYLNELVQYQGVRFLKDVKAMEFKEVVANIELIYLPVFDGWTH